MDIAFLMLIRRFCVVVVVLLLTSRIMAQPRVAPTRATRFRVTLLTEVAPQPVSGRLIILLSPNDPKGKPLSAGLGSADGSWITAQEIHDLMPGRTIDIDPDQVYYPAPFSRAPPGHYWLMAQLDTGHNANYRFMSPGDLRSEVEELPKFDPAAATLLELSLALRILNHPPVDLPKNAVRFDLVSSLMSAFCGRPIHTRVVVLLPPNYTTPPDSL